MTAAKHNPDTAPTRREREILDVLYCHGESSARAVQCRLHGAPSYSTVRALLAVMERKGIVLHRKNGATYLYRPITPLSEMRDFTLGRLVDVFFAGSVETAIQELWRLEKAPRAPRGEA